MSDLNWGPTPAGWGAPPTAYAPPPPPPPAKSGAGKIVLIVLGILGVIAVVVGAGVAVVIALGDVEKDAKASLSGAWTRQASPDGAFTLELPKDMRSDTLSTELPDGTSVTVPMMALYTESGDDFGLVCFEMDYGEAGIAGGVSIRGGAEGTVAGMGGIVDSYLPATTPLGEAALVTGHIDRIDAQVRVYVVAQGLRLFWVGIVVHNGEEKLADDTLQRAVASIQPA